MNEHEETTFAPRLHVLLASKAPVGLVIRRGPSKQVATIGWDRRTDQFQLGQWLKGRIFERRSDLSPNGRHFLYFAMDQRRYKTDVGPTWTAISLAPFLKAKVLYSKGNAWNGGGLWLGNESYWLNDGPHGSHDTVRNDSTLKRDVKYQPEESYGNECTGVYYHRLIRDGWRIAAFIEVGKWHGKNLFEKTAPAGWTLRKIAHAQCGSPPGKGCYWDEHELIHPATHRTIALPDWEWADLDGDRLVWATDGKLFAGRLIESGLSEAKQLYDFNAMKFEAIQAPY